MSILFSYCTVDTLLLIIILYGLSLSFSQRIEGGNGHTCALDTIQGSVYCWGSNQYGQIGDGITSDTGDRLIPTLVSGMSSGVSEIALGGSHCCVLISSSESMYCWGNNIDGRLGDGTVTNRFSPVLVSGMSSDVTAITTGRTHSCAIKSGGVLFCWGDNAFYQVGEGTSSMTDRLIPFVTISSDVKLVMAGSYHTCAILTNNIVKCWGRNDNGQVGITSANSISNPTVATAIASVSNITGLALGELHSCVWTLVGAVYCWGDNDFGQLGDGTTTTRYSAELVNGLTFGIINVVSKIDHTCALDSTQAIYCWGKNNNGQIGDGTNINANISKVVSGMISDVYTIGIGYYHSCAVKINGNIFCWGYNHKGQLGNGLTSNVNTAVIVNSLQLNVSIVPSASPSLPPSASPSYDPSVSPSRAPTVLPSLLPSKSPSHDPSVSPSRAPTVLPSPLPSKSPSHDPSVSPSRAPTFLPSLLPSKSPSYDPSVSPSRAPTVLPSPLPSKSPSYDPSVSPSRAPTFLPSLLPSESPSCIPTNEPSNEPSFVPSMTPTEPPSFTPTEIPSMTPSESPSCVPTEVPSMTPSESPSCTPTEVPSMTPSEPPSCVPTEIPSMTPSESPSCTPTEVPSAIPSEPPSCTPTEVPSMTPSESPSCVPTEALSTPSESPSCTPTEIPSMTPSESPSCVPTEIPSMATSESPSCTPTEIPSMTPSEPPSCVPTEIPSMTTSESPSCNPTEVPSMTPSESPSCVPTEIPSMTPTEVPSCNPTEVPSTTPSESPSCTPTEIPSVTPTEVPSTTPSESPSCTPTEIPTHYSTASPSYTQTETPSSSSTVSSSYGSHWPLSYAPYAIVNTSLPANGSLLELTNINLINFPLFRSNDSLQTVSFVSNLAKTSLSAISFPSVAANVSKSNSSSMVIAIPIPTSSSTVSLSVPSSLSTPDALGIMVSVVEFSSDLFGGSVRSNSLQTNTSNGAAGQQQVSASVLVSDVISISMTVVSRSNTSQTTTILPSFETGLTIDTSSIDMSDELARSQLVHNCTIGLRESISVKCRSSQVWLNLTCTGDGAARVRRLCPMYRQVCSVLNLVDKTIASTDYCETISTGVSSVVCRCGFNEEVNRNASLLLSQLNGRVSVAAVGSFASSRLDVSALPVATTIAGDVVTQSVLVLVTFGVLWIMGCLCIGTILSEKMDINNKATGSVLPLPKAHAGDTIYRYVASALPIMWQMDRSWFEIFAEILVKRHKLICVVHTFVINLRSKRSDGRINQRIGKQKESLTRHQLLDVLYVVTALTMSLFVLAVLYDLQSPVDDGYCGRWTDASSCLATRTLLDTTIHKCVWTEPVDTTPSAALVTESAILDDRLISSTSVSSQTNANTQSSCELNTNTLSSRAYLLTFLMTSLLTLMIICMLDVMFEVIVADTKIIPASKNKNDVDWWKRHWDLISVVPMNTHNQIPRAIMQEENVFLVPDEVQFARNMWLASLSISAPPSRVGNAAPVGIHLVQVFLLETLLVLYYQGNCDDVDARLVRHMWRWTLRHWFGEEKQSWSVYWQYAVYAWLLMLHGGAMYFLLSKAAMRGFGWQIAFFQATLWEVVLDAGLVMPLEILVLDYVVPIVGVFDILESLHLSLKEMCYDAAMGGRATEFYMTEKMFVDTGHDELAQSSQNEELAYLLKKYDGTLPEVELIRVLMAKRYQLLHSPVAVDEKLSNLSRLRQRAFVSVCRRFVLNVVRYVPSVVFETMVQLMASSFATLVVYLVLFVIQPGLRPYFPEKGNNAGLVTVSWLLVGCPILGWILYGVTDAAFFEGNRMNRRLTMTEEVISRHHTEDILHHDTEKDEEISHDTVDSDSLPDMEWSCEEEECDMSEDLPWMSTSPSFLTSSSKLSPS